MEVILVSDIQGYIFAAGSSQRLGDVARGEPKSLVQVGDRMLVEHHLDALIAQGVRDLTIVVGYRARHYRETLGHHYCGVPLRYVENPLHDEYGQFYSLYVGRNIFHGPSILINADVYCSPEFIETLVTSSAQDLMLLDSTYPVLTGDEVIICGAEGRVHGLSLGSPPEGIGEFVGINRFSAQTLAALCDYGWQEFRERWKGKNYEWVLDGFIRAVQPTVYYHDVARRDWVNVNYPDDLVVAHQLAGVHHGGGRAAAR
jgi:choline kinase